MGFPLGHGTHGARGEAKHCIKIKEEEFAAFLPSIDANSWFCGTGKLRSCSLIVAEPCRGLGILHFLLHTQDPTWNKCKIKWNYRDSWDASLNIHHFDIELRTQNITNLCPEKEATAEKYANLNSKMWPVQKKGEPKHGEVVFLDARTSTVVGSCTS